MLPARSDGGRDSVHHLIVPLIEGRNLPVSARYTGEAEVAVGIALRERKIFAVRIAQADVGLGEGVAVVRAAAVQPFIRRPAHAAGRDVTLDRIVAARVPSAQRFEALVDDVGVGETDTHVITRRPEFLEICGLANAHEGIVRLLAVESVGLQPLFAASDAVGGRGGDHAIAALVQVGHYSLPC